MAKQAGIFNLVGPLGGLSFYKTADGYFVRKKGGIKKERIMNAPRFQRTRENAAEFGRANTSGKLLRIAFHPLLELISDRLIMRRLTCEMLKVIQSDTVNRHGQRNAADGDPGILRGFEFNSTAKLNATLCKPYCAGINRETGAVSISIPELLPYRDVKMHQGATHLKFVAAGAELDFKNELSQSFSVESELISVKSEAVTTISLSGSLPGQNGLPQFLAFGIIFYRNFNGTFDLLNHGEFNCLSLVAVSVPPRSAGK